MLSIATVLAVVVAVALLGSIAVVRRLHSPARPWRESLGERFVLGVPWGTIVVIVFVLCIYLFVQDGLANFDDPVTIPFRAWSYFYPLGMATAGLSHAGPNHLLGNLIGTLAVAPIAEYAWGHYPEEDRSAADWRTTPWVRAFLLFPLVAIGVALLTSLFALGPVIGFSGVVFAFAGFAIVHYPIVTIIGTIGVQGVIGTVYRALQNPITVYVAQPSPPAPPSWATIAIQGHALGFVIGLVLGIFVLRQRGRRPDAVRIWIAVLLYGFSSSLWAIYWFGGENTYILFRGPGVVVVTLLSLVITLAIAGSDSPLLPRRLRTLGDRAGGARSTVTDRVLEATAGAGALGESALRDRPDRVRGILNGERDREWSLRPLSQQQAGFLAVLVVFACLAGVAIPVNLLVLEESAVASNSSVEIEDYTVMYAEDAENELVTGIPIEQLQEGQGLASSGVIVASEQRNIWLEAVSTQALAFSGEETVSVGGPGWREAVHVERTGWEPVGNDTVYQVQLREDGGDDQLAYTSNSSQADVRIDNRTVAVVPDDGAFGLEVADADTETVDQATIPAANETVTAGGLTFERDGDAVYASKEGTAVAVAHEEQYE